MTQESLLGITVAEYLTRLASPAPIPGGGSAAALVGALAAALGQMAAGLTVGKPKFAAQEPRVREIAERLARAEVALRTLIDEDANAYAKLSAAFKLDRNAPGRAAAITDAARVAACVPLQTAALAHAVSGELAALVPLANPNLRADLNAGLHFARAALQAAAENVRANLPLLPADEAGQIQDELESMRKNAE